MTGKKKTIHFEASSGNVFEDLGVPEPDQALVKADLVKEICGHLAGRDLRQSEIAQHLGIPQPKVSLLLRGRIDGFSTDYLMRLLNRLGRSISIVVQPPAPGRIVGSTHVVHGVASMTATPPSTYGARKTASAGRALPPIRAAARKAVRVKVSKKK